jgi:uncharacterized protein YjbI with pentapeptide repeats
MEPDKTPRKRAEDLISLLVPDWRPDPQQGLWAMRIGIVLGLLVAIGYFYGITLWDWLKLLIIPAVLAVGGYLFTRSENRATRMAAERRTQDEALQAYLDQMGQMLLDKDRPLRQSREGDEQQTLARARTLTVLRRLDRYRKETVVQFLYESYLLTKKTTKKTTVKVTKDGTEETSEEVPKWITNGPVVLLFGADLRRINLRGATLGRVHLADADLSGADLSGARLSDLPEAFLREADLSGTDLSGANLSNVTLASSSYLPEFAQIGMEEIPIGEEPTKERKQEMGRRAESIKELTVEEKASRELEYLAKSLEGATMPNGQKYEDWLKSKDRGEGDSATPEQRGPWWGGPYHRPWWRRMFDA